MATMLEAAKCKVNTGGTDWLSTGDFDSVFGMSGKARQRYEPTSASPQTQADTTRYDEAKAQRLRRLYVPLIECVQALEQVVIEKSWVAAGDTVDDRDARHRQMVEAKTTKVQEIAGELWIEPSTDEVRKAYETAIGASQKYLQMLKTNSMGGSISAEEFSRQGEEVSRTAKALQIVIVEQLAELERVS